MNTEMSLRRIALWNLQIGLSKCGQLSLQIISNGQIPTGYPSKIRVSLPVLETLYHTGIAQV